jgi:hypothetical protein
MSTSTPPPIYMETAPCELVTVPYPLATEPRRGYVTFDLLRRATRAASHSLELVLGSVVRDDVEIEEGGRRVEQGGLLLAER